MNGIRRAVKEDITSILQLLVQVDMVHHNGRPDLFKGPTTKYSAEELSRLLTDEKTPVFVSVNERGEVEGHAFCVLQEHKGDNLLVDGKTLYIDDICVDEKARGKGVGKGLYDYVINYAKTLGCYNVTLNVWTCNPGALRFYEKCGMTPQKIGMEKILR